MAKKIASGIIHGIIVSSNKPFCKMMQRNTLSDYVYFFFIVRLSLKNVTGKKKNLPVGFNGLKCSFDVLCGQSMKIMARQINAYLS